MKKHWIGLVGIGLLIAVGAGAFVYGNRHGEERGDSQGVDTCVCVHLLCLTRVWKRRKRPSTGAVAVERTRP